MAYFTFREPSNEDRNGKQCSDNGKFARCLNGCQTYNVKKRRLRKSFRKKRQQKNIMSMIGTFDFSSSSTLILDSMYQWYMVPHGSWFMVHHIILTNRNCKAEKEEKNDLSAAYEDKARNQQG